MYRTLILLGTAILAGSDLLLGYVLYSSFLGQRLLLLGGMEFLTGLYLERTISSRTPEDRFQKFFHLIFYAICCLIIHHGIFKLALSGKVEDLQVRTHILTMGIGIYGILFFLALKGIRILTSKV